MFNRNIVPIYFVIITACSLSLLVLINLYWSRINGSQDIYKENNFDNLSYHIKTNHSHFLHITDIHGDIDYLVGSDPDTYCHRMGKGKHNNTGIYGASGSQCDSPMKLIEDTFQFFKEKYSKKVDFIIDTGDVVRHHRDINIVRNKETVVEDHWRIAKIYNNTFDFKKVRMVPTLGNNDLVRHDRSKENDPLYQEIAKVWKTYNLDVDKQESFLRGGYYVVELKKGLIAVSLNTLLFYKKNPEVEDCDEPSSLASKQLKYLSHQLKMATRSNSYIYIVGHIPPNKANGKKLYKKECYSRYLKLIGEHSTRIIGFFHGHSNKDYVNVLIKEYSSQQYKLITLNEKNQNLRIILRKGEIVSVILNNPSIIPVYNPSFRYYQYDNENQIGKLISYTQYFNNLTKSNQEKKLSYQIEYSTTKDYKLPDLSFNSLKRYVSQLIDNSDSLNEYFTFIKVLE